MLQLALKAIDAQQMTPPITIKRTIFDAPPPNGKGVGFFHFQEITTRP